ncbi:glycosyl transferase [Actinoplanes ianthinogenes]|uniref:Glycosyl transferase n=2 Tax=Actinoplanes ianthinogenes TaxID=122358 RepID=A0ABM7M1T0_9ACTN|nr:glycosyl transferase [Actinoplanes ianthinogenes]GGR49677.1 glycosyl transferase [Actinoplanes ianthinogenes]
MLEERDEAVPATVRTGFGGWRRSDLWALLGFVALAVLVMIRLWVDPNGRVLDGNDDDHGIFLFMLAHGERVIFDGAPPFFESHFNAPVGVNMMANTAILALSLPLAPVTHFLGGGVSVAIILTFGLAGTAAAWYWLFARHLVRSRRAALIGALWCGFGPTMISHANGHLNFVNQYLVPFIVWQVLRLREPGRAVRGGITLGLLILLQIFINEETLLFTALTLGVFVLSYAIMRPAEARATARRFLAGLGVAAGTTLALAGYPLWYQFFGPGNYHGQPFAPTEFVTDLLALGAYPRQSVAGIDAVTERLSVSATEDNTFFGPIGLLMIIVSLRMLWQNAAARSAAIAGLVLLLASMGPRLQVAGVRTAIPLPFGLISHVPVIDLVSVSRFAMVPATIAGILLALAADKIDDYSPVRRRRFWAGMTLALVPLFPTPAPVVQGDPLPEFLTAGTWKQYVPEGRTLVPVPLPEVTTGRTAQRWATLENLDFAVPRGYFMGPANPPDDRTGSWRAPVRPTSELLAMVQATGIRPVISEGEREQIRADLVYWRAAVVVLIPQAPNVAALRATLTDALGKPQLVGGVEIWDVRALVGVG